MSRSPGASAGRGGGRGVTRSTSTSGLRYTYGSLITEDGFNHVPDVVVVEGGYHEFRRRPSKIQRFGDSLRRHSTLILATVGAMFMVTVAAVTIINNFDSDISGRPSSPQQQSTATAGVGFGTLAGFEDLRQPEERVSKNGVLETTLRIEPTKVTWQPLTYWARTYEGTVPAPTLRVKPGDVLKITQVNHLLPDRKAVEVPQTFQLPNTTTIHTHGLHISPDGVADNIFRHLGSGEEALSVYEIPKDHQPGTFYYHPHYHGSSSVQMLGGMSGALIVDDDPATLPPEMVNVRDLVFVLQHMNAKFGTFKNYAFSNKVSHSLLDHEITPKWPEAPWNYYTVNGQYQPVLSVSPGEVVRLRLINAGVSAYLLVKVPGCSMYEIAADGVYYKSPRSSSDVILVVGSRKDILLRCDYHGLYPAASSKQKALLEGYLGKGTDIFEGTLFYVSASGPKRDDKVPTTLPALPTRLFPTEGLQTVPDAKVGFFKFEFFQGIKEPRDGVMYTRFGVNHHINGLFPVYRKVALGSVEEWRVTSVKEDGSPVPVNHPFHIHVNHFQIVDMSHGQGLDYQIGDWRDTISLPTLPYASNGYVKIRWRANDFTGKAPAHCHIISHADVGMSMSFEIYDSENPPVDEVEAPKEQSEQSEMVHHHEDSPSGSSSSSSIISSVTSSEDEEALEEETVQETQP